jgi:hypothetical protein
VSCSCKIGHVGSGCNTCAAGFVFGFPGGPCVPSMVAADVLSVTAVVRLVVQLDVTTGTDATAHADYVCAHLTTELARVLGIEPGRLRATTGPDRSGANLSLALWIAPPLAGLSAPSAAAAALALLNTTVSSALRTALLGSSLQIDGSVREAFVFTTSSASPTPIDEAVVGEGYTAPSRALLAHAALMLLAWVLFVPAAAVAAARSSGKPANTAPWRWFNMSIPTSHWLQWSAVGIAIVGVAAVGSASDLNTLSGPHAVCGLAAVSFGLLHAAGNMIQTCVSTRTRVSTRFQLSWNIATGAVGCAAHVAALSASVMGLQRMLPVGAVAVLAAAPAVVSAAAWGIASHSRCRRDARRRTLLWETDSIITTRQSAVVSLAALVSVVNAAPDDQLKAVEPCASQPAFASSRCSPQRRSIESRCGAFLQLPLRVALDRPASSACSTTNPAYRVSPQPRTAVGRAESSVNRPRADTAAAAGRSHSSPEVNR